MPTYQYKCPTCGAKVDIVHSPGEMVLIPCPKQDGGILRRVFSAPRVNWGGLPPSKGEIHPNIKRELEKGYRRRRDRGA